MTTTEVGLRPGSKRLNEANESNRAANRLLDGRMFWDVWFSMALLPWITVSPRGSGSNAAALGPDRFDASRDRADGRNRGSRHGNVVYVNFR